MQGGTFKDLRELSAKQITEIDSDMQSADCPSVNQRISQSHVLDADCVDYYLKISQDTLLSWNPDYLFESADE